MLNRRCTAPKPRRRRRAISVDSDDEEHVALIEEISRCKEADVKPMKVEEKRLELDRIRCEREWARQELDAKNVTVKEKRLQLDGRKYDMEIQERKAAVEKRKSILKVQSAPAQKLQ